jgi:hypothetical protein
VFDAAIQLECDEYLFRKIVPNALHISSIIESDALSIFRFSLFIAINKRHRLL